MRGEHVQTRSFCWAVDVDVDVDVADDGNDADVADDDESED